MDKHSEVLLELNAVETWHGSLRALSNVSLTVSEGSITVILGNNGAGKSTLLNTILGVLEGQPKNGQISFQGIRIDRMATERIVRSGISYVPEGRRIFRDLTVWENLKVGAYVQRDQLAAKKALERVCEFFPLLAERQSQAAGTLSGGEQQMLAIGRALVGNPNVLLMDEPSEGLAPVIVEELQSVINLLREESSMTIVLVEQNSRVALEFSERCIVMNRGRIVRDGSSEILREDQALLERLIGMDSSML